MTLDSLSPRVRRTVPMLPFPDQRALHLHEGAGRQLAAGDPDELSWVPGQFGVRGDRGDRGFRGFRGERGEPGMDGSPGLDTPPSAPDGDLRKPPSKPSAKPFFDIEGLLRFPVGTTLLETLTAPANWGAVAFPTADPGGGQIWLSAT